MTQHFTSQHSAHFGHDGHDHGPHTPTHTSPESTATAEYCEADETGQAVHQRVHQLFSKNPDWVSFYRDVLGLNGIIRQAFPHADQLAQFEQTREYEEIQHMVARLREQSTSKQGTTTFEPTRVITVRLPKSLHESLRAEAHEKRTSMNKLCISKLLQFITNDLVPTEQ